jgi:predicted PurR-regulated permease PerM
MSSTPPREPATSTPLPPPTSRAATVVERRALSGFAVIAVLAIGWIARPVSMGILLGALTAFALQPLYDRLRLKTKRSELAALGCVLVAALGFGLSLGGLSYLFVARGAVIVGNALGAFRPDGPGRHFVERLAEKLGPLRLEPDDIAGKLRDAATAVATQVAALATAAASATFSMILVMFFLMMTVFFTLERWPEIARNAENMLPLRPRYTRDLLEEFRNVGRTTLLGTVATGLAQGLLAAVGYFVTGVPEAAFFGAATAVASLIPAVGTLLVWVPTGIFLIATGHPAMGALELAWGGLMVVGASDYIIRPALVGGVEAFGLVGLVLGPLVMALSFSVLRIFADDAAAQKI